MHHAQLLTFEGESTTYMYIKSPRQTPGTRADPESNLARLGAKQSFNLLTTTIDQPGAWVKWIITIQANCIRVTLQDNWLFIAVCRDGLFTYCEVNTSRNNWRSYLRKLKHLCEKVKTMIGHDIDIKAGIEKRSNIIEIRININDLLMGLYEQTTQIIKSNL